MNRRAQIEANEEETFSLIDSLPQRQKYEKKVRLAKTYVMVDGIIEMQLWAFIDRKNGRRDKFKVAFQREGEQLLVRNMTFCGGSGYIVSFPGETCHSYYAGTPGKKNEEWAWGGWRGAFNPNATPLKTEEQAIAMDESLKYFRPCDGNPLVEQVAVYREYPQSEALFKLGLGKLACQTRIYHLSRELTKGLCKYIFRNAGEIQRNQNLSWVMSAFSLNMDYGDFLLKKVEAGKEREKYIISQHIDAHAYADYFAMARAQGYDLKDRKWRFPRDFHAMHDSLLAVSEGKKMDEFNKGISVHSRSLSQLCASVGGYTFRFPVDYTDFRRQAEELGNCLISNGYFKRYASGDVCIVFVMVGEKRVGTAQISEKDGKVVQFTANQKSCWKPDAEMQGAFEEWRKGTFVPWAKERKMQCAGAR